MPYVSTSLLRLPLLLLSLLCGLAWLTGCGDAAEETDLDEAFDAEALYFEPVGRGFSALLVDTTEIVIRDAATWVAYEDSLRPLRSFEVVDFSQAMVLLVALPAPSAGYTIDFTSIEKTGDTIVASYQLLEPGDDCLVAVASTTPFVAVLARRASGDVRFVRQRRDYPCRTG